jgi:hypothetical protein
MTKHGALDVFIASVVRYADLVKGKDTDAHANLCLFLRSAAKQFDELADAREKKEK